MHGEALHIEQCPVLLRVFAIDTGATHVGHHSVLFDFFAVHAGAILVKHYPVLLCLFALHRRTTHAVEVLDANQCQTIRTFVSTDSLLFIIERVNKQDKEIEGVRKISIRRGLRGYANSPSKAPQFDTVVYKDTCATGSNSVIHLPRAAVHSSSGNARESLKSPAGALLDCLTVTYSRNVFEVAPVRHSLRSRAVTSRTQLFGFSLSHLGHTQRKPIDRPRLPRTSNSTDLRPVRFSVECEACLYDWKRTAGHTFEAVCRVRISEMASSLDRRKHSLVGISSIWTFLLLLVVPVIQADKTAADYFISSLPGAPDGPLLKMHAGYENMFFEAAQDSNILADISKLTTAKTATYSFGTTRIVTLQTVNEQ